ncbi:MAG: 3-phosphoshikimate 1-carboxyvinyltransferase [Candidatus Neomarinimicrobiota bacterium]|jgi:3-phosphoshikimate 1-carboxyvinyltransferase|nr:3-phosphoshikimate 1-carboxyvinyltransferase [Candidatus Neomarinimicrobiota bacterium]MDD3966205.1 3-phosphoshikimate 1-carboxyvinyltransferase [Candidatus Neomarinimicrobiota bacterium]MDX9779767.1 3-phosphoshikimate 1-carboxyvinyltransferase [bacterium]
MKTRQAKIIQPIESIRGQITLPGDKSMSHRALIFAAIARGNSKIRHLNIGADALSTIACLQKLGVTFQLGKFTVDVSSPGIFNWTTGSGTLLNCGNSGTTVRLLAGLLAGIPGIEVSLTGDASLSRRPMRRIIEPLQKMGAEIESKEGCLPIRIKGKVLKGIHYVLPVASAQVKSCILLAGLSAQGKTYVEEPIATRDHTENMMKLFHIPVFRNKKVVSVHTLRRKIAGFEYSIPGDPSSAAYWVAAALLLKKSRILLRKISLNPTRTAYIRLLKNSGALIDILPEAKKIEAVGDIVVHSSNLKAFSINSRIVPGLIDEIPLLALIATQAKGISRIHGAKELRFKESDRIRTSVEMLRALGAEVEEYEDGMDIKGPCPLQGGIVNAYGDHRIAMTASIAGLIANDTVQVRDWSSVDISYPNFYPILERISKL